MADTISRILVPVDFSAGSEQTLRYALGLARRLNASLELMHVVGDPFASGAWNPEVYVPNIQELLTNLIADAQRRLEVLTQTAGDGAGAIRVRVRCGSPADVIVEQARDGGFDLIVMATHGRSGLAHVVMGSVAERVLRRAHCPVLTMRTTVTERTTSTSPAEAYEPALQPLSLSTAPAS